MAPGIIYRMETSRTPPPLSDSPWFWAYLFATAGLVALWLASGKYSVRQGQIERQFQAREEARLAQGGKPAKLPVPTSFEQLRVPLRPLYLILAPIVAGCWIVFWLRRRQAFSLVNSPSSTGKT